MLPAFLVPEIDVEENGSGTVLDLGSAHGTALRLTLGITRALEQESLDLSIWGSADGATWQEHPLASFPQKFYCGTYSILVDLSKHPEVRCLQARWKMNRWGRGSLKPKFGFYLFVQASTALGASA